MNRIVNFLKLVFLLSVLYTPIFSQESNDISNKSPLETEILKMDSLLFDVAFNECDLDLFKKIISPEIEFYDDRSGLNTSLESELASFRDKCSKPVSITRQLVTSSVHVLGDYGAVQLGEHEFYVDGHKVEKANFVTVWERSDDSWVVKRAISYDHTALSN